MDIFGHRSNLRKRILLSYQLYFGHVYMVYECMYASYR